MKRKIIAWLTAAAVVAGMMPGMAMPVFASGGTAVNGSDALAALGIDTSIAPEGFDENDSVSNPYGRKTIEVTPVKELYTVGMSEKPLKSNDQRTYNTGKTDKDNDKIEVGETKTDHDTRYASSNKLVSTLYGDEKWQSTTTSDIISKGNRKTLADGSSSFNGKYSVIASGTYEENSKSGNTTGYLSGMNNISSSLGKDFGSFGMSDVAAGNFDGNTKALEAQTVMAYTKDYSHYGGIYLKFGDAKSGSYGSAKELLPAGKSSGKTIGNPDLMITDNEGASQKAENFAENPYQLKNYLQVATGDWNGDGFDEVAVYVPEKGKSRIVVYALQLNNDDKDKNGIVKKDVYTDPAKWGTAWTYALKEGEVVSNMVSLVSADVNQDGIDDLACTWGYYFGPENNAGSKAVVMFGGKGTEIFKKDQRFDLTYGSSNIVRGSFLFGDLTGSGEESLILCGQSDSDLKAGNINSRYVAAYTWNGSTFQISSTLSKNFDLFSKDDNEDLIYGAMSRSTEHFYSSPLAVSDTAVITRPIGEDGGDLLYFDSLIIEYTDSGLNIKEAWDTSKAMQSDTGSPQDYVEYSANAADLTGRKGAGALAVITQTMSSTTTTPAYYTQKGTHKEPVFGQVSYYKNWWHKIFRKRSYKQVITGYKDVQGESTVNVDYDRFNESHTYMTVIDRSEGDSETGYYTKHEEVDSSMALCMANTDNDSSVMNYTGKHYYTYTDPKILAVLASPPYFKDLLDRDDLSGNYAESTTTYSSSKGSGSGTTSSSTISAGAYVSFEQDIKIFGVTVASVEAETQITAGFTWETENTSTLEQTITYSTTAGEDKVAFYSIPMEVYEYQSFVPDGKGGYEEVTTTVNVPHEASIRLLGLDDYEAIASDYSILPQISDAVLTHTVGDPASYPSSITPYRSTKIAMFEGNPAKVGFTSAGGGSAISQEISMTNEDRNAYTGTTSIEAKAGAGAGGVKVGVVAGFEGGGGTVTVSTAGSSFSGELQDMPAEAEAYGYDMNWRIFCYKYADSNMSFPVVSYIVSDVAQPYSLPEDFRQNVAKTTEDSVTLEWTYDKMVSGFQIYRYYEFPDGSGSYRLEYVPFSKGTPNGDGTYSFSYTDKNLNPYTEYSYQIQTESAFKPKVSIYSEPLACRTKTTTGYPEITVTGLEGGNLPVFPDKDNSEVKVNIADADKYKGHISYQWQKLVNNEWTDISGAKTDTYNISRASAADQGKYRCRVNVIYFDDTSKKEFQISAYSQEFTAVYSKRVPVSDITVTTDTKATTGGKVQNNMHAQVELHSLDSETAPTGNAVFTITGTDFETSVPVQLKEATGTKQFDGVSKHYSTAVLDIPSTSPKIAELAKGAYNISVYYAGDTVFKDLTSDYDDMVLIGSGVTGYQLKLSDKADGSNITKFTYGDDIYASLLAKTGNDSKAQPVTEKVKYMLITQKQAEEEAAELAKAAGKQDKSKVFTAANADITAGTDGKLSFKAAPGAGVYKLRAYVDDKAVYEASVTIGQKSITVYVDRMDNIKQDEVSQNKPVIKCKDESGEALPEALVQSFNLGFKAVNSAGNKISLVDNMEPGNYVVTPYPVSDDGTAGSAATPESFYNNYSATYESAVYTVIGLTYEMNAVAVEYENRDGKRPVGTVQIIGTDSLSQYYAAGTAIQFYAKAIAGYEVDHWSYQRKDGEEVTYQGTESGSTVNTERLNITMEANAATVRVYFKPKKISLRAYNDGGSSVGSVVCESDESFSSGAYVSNGAPFTFKAVPAEGYHFRDWSVSETGKNTYTEKGTANGDGTNSVDITVGNESIELKANFERDSYTLNLEGNISASYTRRNTAGADQKIDVKNGASIVGDTVITVEPKTGYRPADEAKFIVNGAEVEFSGEAGYSYRFPLTENTTVSLETVQNMYEASASAENNNGTVAIKVGDTAVDGNKAENIPGGTTVSFTARAKRGYRLSGWMVDGSKSEETGDVLTVSAIGGNIKVEALFTQDAASYTAKAAVTPSDRGGMNYTLYDIYGDIVKEDAAVPDEGITVYNGEKILFKAVPDKGYMVEQWANGEGNNKKYIASSSKTYPDGEITVADSNINITAQLKPSSMYDLDWIAMGEEGSAAKGSLSVTSDNDVLPGSSADVAGGSTVVFTADPSEGYMVDHWTVTDGSMDVTENTEPYKNADGTVYVDPVLTMDGYSGHKTVRVYFKAIETNQVELTSFSDGTVKAAVTYVTPIKPTDTGKQTDGTVTAQVRSGGKVTFTLAPTADYFLINSDLKGSVEEALSDPNAIVKVNGSKEEGLYTVEISNMNSGLTLDMESLFKYRPLHSITLPGDDTVGGKVTASPAQAREGDTVTLTVVPDSSYRFTSIAVDKGKLNEEFKESTLTYTFAMPDENVNVAASFTRKSSGGGSIGGGGGGDSVPDKPATDPVPDTGTTDPSVLQFTGNVSSLTGGKAEATANKDGSVTVKTGSDSAQKIALDVKNAGDGAAAYIVKADGTEELVRDSVVIDGKLYLSVEDGAVIKIADSSISFTDVTETAWSKAAIEFASGRGLFNGVSADRFGRETEMTREMLMTVIARLNNADTSGDALKKGMEWAKKSGISDGSAPKSNVTREQIVTMLYRNAGRPEVKADSNAVEKFKDSDNISAYAKDAMTWAVENGIINGMGSTGKIAPGANATREQVAQMMKNYISSLYR